MVPWTWEGPIPLPHIHPEAQTSGSSGQGRGGQRLNGDKSKDTPGQGWSGRSTADLAPMSSPHATPPVTEGWCQGAGLPMGCVFRP